MRTPEELYEKWKTHVGHPDEKPVTWKWLKDETKQKWERFHKSLQDEPSPNDVPLPNPPPNTGP